MTSYQHRYYHHHHPFSKRPSIIVLLLQFLLIHYLLACFILPCRAFLHLYHPSRAPPFLVVENPFTSATATRTTQNEQKKLHYKNNKNFFVHHSSFGSSKKPLHAHATIVRPITRLWMVTTEENNHPPNTSDEEPDEDKSRKTAYGLEFGKHIGVWRRNFKRLWDRLTGKWNRFLKKKRMNMKEGNANILPEEEQANNTNTGIQENRSEMRLPEGPRWAFASDSTNLSGHWKPIVTSEFKHNYDQYLQNCTQSALFRRVVLSTLGFTEDEIKQIGRNLTMTSKNPAGSWTRTLISSGAETTSTNFEPLHVNIRDPDSDQVEVESWWEQNGTIHRSFLRGKPRVKGGEFETLRYLEDDNTLITESMFHPPQENHGSFKPGYVKWRFQRVG